MNEWQNKNYFQDSVNSYGFYDENKKRNNYNNDSLFGINRRDINGALDVGKDIYSLYQGGGSYMPLIFGGLNAGKTAIQGGSWKDDVPQSFFGIDDSNDSEIMQALKGAGKGAVMGLPFGGPIGAVVGGVLGLGASFLDDI